jgi:DNA-binding response OmpR family regulator
MELFYIFPILRVTNSMPMQVSILLVDDDVDVLASVKLILETEDHKVYTACNADQAKAIILEKEVQIVIMDYILPERTGDQIVKDLKGMKEELNIIFLSGFPQVYRAVENLGFEVDRVFLKPVNPEALLSEIRKIYLESIAPHQPVDMQHVLYETR